MLPAICASYAIPARPEPARLLNDYAGIFTPRERMAIERMLVEFDDSTSNQIAVVTVNDLEGYSASAYATQIGIEWGIGTGEKDNGIVLLIKPKTGSSNGDVAISVGYGLEGAILDVYCNRIIDRIIIPYFASGDYFSGTVAGCSKLMELASGEISVHREDKSEFSLFGLLGLFIMFSILFFIILGRGNGDDKGGNNGGHGGPADDILKGIIIGSMLGGGRDRNGWGGHSGGYGGGDFGGFGGFGGGDFGGGGASGRW